MGRDCSIVFYRGTPLSPAELSQAFRRAPGLEQALVTLAAGHAQAAIVSPDDPHDAGRHTHALSLFTKVARFKRVSTEPGVGKPALLSGLVKSALKKVVSRPPEPEEQIRDQYPGLPVDWVVRVAVEISRVRDRALWAMVADQSRTGGFAVCQAGAVVDERMCEGDSYEDIPNLALSRFSGVKGVHVHHGFRHPADTLTASTSYMLFSERGQFLDPPRSVATVELSRFAHLL